MALQIPDPKNQSDTSTPLAILMALTVLAVVGTLLYIFGLGILAVIFVVLLLLDDFIPVWRRHFQPLPLNILH
jgi:hypothetical protein